MRETLAYGQGLLRAIEAKQDSSTGSAIHHRGHRATLSLPQAVLKLSCESWWNTEQHAVIFATLRRPAAAGCPRRRRHMLGAWRCSRCGHCIGPAAAAAAVALFQLPAGCFMSTPIRRQLAACFRLLKRNLRACPRPLRCTCKPPCVASVLCRHGPSLLSSHSFPPSSLWVYCHG